MAMKTELTIPLALMACNLVYPAQSGQRQRSVRRSFSKFGAAIFLTMILGGLWFSGSAALAADEICATCGQQVSVSGDFAHRKDDVSVVIEGTNNNAAAFREEIYGSNFTVIYFINATGF